MVLLKSFCGCLPLRTGGIVLGSFMLLPTVVMCILNFIAAIGMFNEKEAVVDDKISTVLYLGLGLMHMVFSVMLIYGSSEGRHGFILPSLVLAEIGVAVLTVFILFIAGNLAFGASRTILDIGADWTLLGILAVVWVVKTYIMLCLHYLYHEIKRGRNHESDITWKPLK